MTTPAFPDDGIKYVKPGQEGENDYALYIEVFNGEGKFLGEVGDYMDASLSWNSEADNAESSSFTIPHPSLWSKTMMRANHQVTLIRCILTRAGKQIKKWTGRVERAVRSTEGGESHIKVELISDKAWLAYILAWPSPFADINTQLPKHDTQTGPAIHVMKKYLIKNILRFNTDNMPKERGKYRKYIFYNPLADRMHTYQDDSSKFREAMGHMDPFIVVPTAYGADTSPTVTLTARMDKVSEIWQEACKDFNLLPVVETYYPGRDPLPAGVPATGRDTPSIIVDIIDKDKARSARKPMTKWERYFDVASSFLQSVVGVFDTTPQLKKQNETSLTEFFGNATEDKWVIFRESSKHWSSTEVSVYAPTTIQTIAGGSSMEFINDAVHSIVMALINFILRWFGLDVVLDAILGDKLKDVFFAFQRVSDRSMQSELGKFAFYETYTGTGTTALSADAAQGIRSARWAALGYRTATFSGDAAAFPPFRPFEDFDLLDPVGWEDEEEGQIFTERAKEISVSVDRDGGVQFELRLGESERPEEPWAIQKRQNDRFKQAINAAFDKD